MRDSILDQPVLGHHQSNKDVAKWRKRPLNPSDLYAFGRAQISNKAALSQKTEIRLAGAVIQVAGISWNDVQTFTVSAKSIGASVPEPSFKDPTASAEATYLKQRNQQLAEEVTKLRSLLNERNKETKELRTLLA